MAGAPPALAAAPRRPVGAAGRALAEWLSHLIAVAAVLSGFHAVGSLVARLGGYGRSAAVGSLFDAADAGLIVGFLAIGVVSVLRIYGAEEEPEPADLPQLRGLRLRMIAALPPPAVLTLGVFGERLIGHLLVYAAILVVSIYLCLFVLMPWPVAVASLTALLLAAVVGAAMFAPRGSVWGKLKWLVEIRVAVGSFAAAIALLLLVEEVLRRSL